MGADVVDQLFSFNDTKAQVHEMVYGSPRHVARPTVQKLPEDEITGLDKVHKKHHD